MRAALYFVPPADSPLFHRASAWLGRDIHTGAPCSHAKFIAPRDLDLDRAVASPRRYGFHATLKAPFALARGRSLQSLATALDAFAARRSGFSMTLQLGEIGNFVALVCGRPCPHVSTLAAACVVSFDEYRAPLTPAETERRMSKRLSAREQQLLALWGYPYVLDRFSFHMTLTGPLDDIERARAMAHLQEWLGPVVGKPISVETIALVVEPGPGAPFCVQSLHRLSADRSRPGIEATKKAVGS